MSKRSRQRNKARQRVNLIPAGTRDTQLASSTSPGATPPAPAPDPSLVGNIQIPPAIHPGRQTQPYNVNPLGLISYSFLPRRQWQAIDVADLTGSTNMTAQQILEILADIVPEVGQSVNNKMRLVNGEWKYQVRTKNGTAELKSGKRKIDDLITRINKDYGGLDAIIDSWTYTAVLQGAMCGEITLTEDLNDVQDIYAVQPWTIYFMRDGMQNLVPFQQQVMVSQQNPLYSLSGAQYGMTQGWGVAGYPFKRLNPLTFGYLPIDAGPDDPYGRPMAGPVLQVVAFQLQLLKDIRQWVHTNAWGRLHIKVLTEMILKAAPDKIKNAPDAATKLAYINARVKEFADAYNQIKPDDAFVTTDAVELDAVDQSGKSFQINIIIQIVKDQLISALKELPVLMGSNVGTTETHGSVQLVIYARTIASIQRKIAALLNKFFNVALQVYGIAGVCEFEFEPLRATDRLMDAQADMAEAQYAVFVRDQGFISQDDASIRATGSEAVSPVPIFREAKQAVNSADQQGNKKDEANNNSDKAGTDVNKNGDSKADSGDGEATDEEQAAMDSGKSGKQNKKAA